MDGVIRRAERSARDRVAFAEAHGDKAPGRDLPERAERGLLEEALPRR